MFSLESSQIAVEPFKSSPLVHGYCGMLQYMLWKMELQDMKSFVHLKHEREECTSEQHGGGADGSEGPHDVKSSIRAQAYVKQALMHFESLRQLDISERDNVNAFTVLHYKVCFSIASGN